MKIMKTVLVSTRKGNVCVTSTTKAELVTCQEQDSQVRASGRKAVDSVAEKQGRPCLEASAAALKLVGIIVSKAQS